MDDLCVPGQYGPQEIRKFVNELQDAVFAGNDQYPKKLSAANDVLVNHTWDKTYNKSKKKAKKNNSSNSTGNNKEKKSDSDGKNFNQRKNKVVCYCCGEEGHFLDDCEKQDKIPKEEWAVKKGLSMFANSRESSSGNNNNNNGHSNGSCTNGQTSTNENRGEQSSSNNRSNWLGMQLY